jgi:hypothetical protein
MMAVIAILYPLTVVEIKIIDLEFLNGVMTTGIIPIDE